MKFETIGWLEHSYTDVVREVLSRRQLVQSIRVREGWPRYFLVKNCLNVCILCPFQLLRGEGSVRISGVNEPKRQPEWFHGCVDSVCLFQKSNEKLAAGEFDKPPPQKVQLKSGASTRAIRAERLAAKNAKRK